MKAFAVLAIAAWASCLPAEAAQNARRYSSANARPASLDARVPPTPAAIAPVSSGIPPSADWPPNARYCYSIDPWLFHSDSPPRAIRHYFGFPENYQGTRRYHAYATLEPPSPIAPEAYYTDPEPGAWMYESRSLFGGAPPQAAPAPAADSSQAPHAAYLRSAARATPAPDRKISADPLKETPAATDDSPQTPTEK